MHPSARGSVTWQATPLWSLRGTAYRAFRAPTLNERFRNFRAGDTLTQANEALIAEQLTGGEISALLAAGRGAGGPRTSTPRSTTPSPTSRCR